MPHLSSPTESESARAEREELAPYGRKRMAELCAAYVDTVRAAAWLVQTLGESDTRELTSDEDGNTPEQRRQKRLKALAIAGQAVDGEIRCHTIADNLFLTARDMDSFLDQWKEETGIGRAEANFHGMAGHSSATSIWEKFLKTPSPAAPTAPRAEMALSIARLSIWQTSCQEAAALIVELVQHWSGNTHLAARALRMLPHVNALNNAAFDIWAQVTQNPAVQAVLSTDASSSVH
ncbi:MAG: hypothetical protein J0L97_07825 [Alphaproteobacteria bacterium]|nr:hypothetical protein [Alphaproteobacteria bacterium]